MKFNTIFLVTVSILFLLTGCQSTDGETLNVLEAMISDVTFPELVEEADLIAHVTIDEKLSERNEPTPKSVYSLEINEVFKGEKNRESTITTVYQLGNEHWVFADNYFTFKQGEDYILFLKETVGVEDSEFWILNEHAGLFQFIQGDTLLKLAYTDNTLESISLTETNLNKVNLNKTNQFLDAGQQAFNKETFISEIKKSLKD